MKSCGALDELFAQHPDVLRREIYRSHLETCRMCRDAEASFRAFSAALRETEAASFNGTPSVEKKLDLLNAARSRPSRRNRRRAVWGWAAAAALLLASATIFFLSTKSEGPAFARRPDEAVSVRRLPDGRTVSDDTSSFSLGRLVTGLGEQLSVTINDDELRILEQTNVGIVDTRKSQTRVRLGRGTVYFEVAERGGDEAFVVDTGPYQVRVIGTRFKVTRENDIEVTVGVFEGIVEVKGPDMTVHRIEAGEWKHFGDDPKSALLTPDTDPTSLLPIAEKNPEEKSSGNDNKQVAAAKADGKKASFAVRSGETRGMDIWRRMIVAGAYEQAEDEILAHLDLNPEDPQAWALLADCLRKAGKYSRSADSYQKVIDLAPAAEADRARLTLGALLQDRLGRHREAVRLLEDYLKNSTDRTSLKAEIMVRLARSYIKIGQNERAEPLLREVVNRHRGNPIAKKAEYLLTEISHPSHDNK